jgi:hypothetical protein
MEWWQVRQAEEQQEYVRRRVMRAAQRGFTPEDYSLLQALDDDGGVKPKETAALIVERLPTHAYVGNGLHSRGDDGQVSTTASCAICLEPYADGSTLRRLPCLHDFHRECIDRWLHMATKCPVCQVDAVEVTKQNDALAEVNLPGDDDVVVVDEETTGEGEDGTRDIGAEPRSEGAQIRARRQAASEPEVIVLDDEEEEEGEEEEDKRAAVGGSSSSTAAPRPSSPLSGGSIVSVYSPAPATTPTGRVGSQASVVDLTLDSVSPRRPRQRAGSGDENDD